MFDRLFLCWFAAGLLAAATSGCVDRTVEAPPARAAAPTYSGPVYLRGTVGSVAQLRDLRPLVVSGYGVVVNLDGTGSSEVPAVIRQRLINDLRRRGVGSIDSLLPGVSAEELLADRNTAVVRVEGLIPAGASAGTTFDLLVSAADTQTTSLAGGDLWPMELSIGGLTPGLDTRELAEGGGPIYVEPGQGGEPAAAINGGVNGNGPSGNGLHGGVADRDAGFQRQAIVLGGGRAVLPRRLELVLNQPGYRRARLIESRINERFPASVDDRRPTAEGKSDAVVRINVPRAWRQDPQELVQLIQHLYLNRAEGFATFQAEALAGVLRERPEEAERVVYAWRALGPNAIPALRAVYGDADFTLRLAALEAGAILGDERAGVMLSDLASHPDPAVRVSIADTLRHLPRNLRGTSTLAGYLEDPDPSVRLAAYDALAEMNDPLIDRVAVGGPRTKFILDRIPAEPAMVYVAHDRRPRVAVFDPGIVFDEKMLARLWNNRLMLRVEGPGSPLTVFYQRPGATAGETHDLRPDLRTLLFFLAHEPTDAVPQPGLDLSFGQVVDVVHALCREGHIDAAFEAEPSRLATIVEEARRRSVEGRPEVTTLDPLEDLEGPEPEE